MTAEEYRKMWDIDFAGVGLDDPAGISGSQDSSPVFRFRLDGSKITILFSDTESKAVKERIRDILTESYEERIQRQIEDPASLEGARTDAGGEARKKTGGISPWDCF